MGQCCTKCNQPTRLVNRQAYKTELGSAFLESLPSTCPADTTVVIVNLRGLNNIIDSGAITSFSGPYVQLKLFPTDPVAGDQIQRSSFKPAEVNPRWVSLAIYHVTNFRTINFYVYNQFRFLQKDFNLYQPFPIKQ